MPVGCGVRAPRKKREGRLALGIRMRSLPIVPVSHGDTSIALVLRDERGMTAGESMDKDPRLMITGYWIHEERIYSRLGYSGFYLDDTKIIGPAGETGFHLTDGRVVGPDGETDYLLDGVEIRGPEGRMPWQNLTI